MNRNQIFRELIGYYLSGADEILVRADKITYEQRAAVRELTYRLIGCECMENVGNQMLLKNNSALNYGDIPDYVHKMMGNIISMFADTIKYLKEKDKYLARDVKERDVELDRLTLAIVRLTNIRMYEIDSDSTHKFSADDAVYYRSITIRLERIGDHIVRIADYYLMIDRKTFENLGVWENQILKNSLHHLHLCQEIISTLQKKKAHQFLDLFLQVNVRKVKKKNPTNRGIMDIVTSESISRINSYVANIAEETINYVNIKSTAEQ